MQLVSTPPKQESGRNAPPPKARLRALALAPQVSPKPAEGDLYASAWNLACPLLRPQIHAYCFTPLQVPRRAGLHTCSGTLLEPPPNSATSAPPPAPLRAARAPPTGNRDSGSQPRALGTAQLMSNAPASGGRGRSRRRRRPTPQRPQTPRGAEPSRRRRLLLQGS